MYEIQVNERGQITIPKELREKIRLSPKDNLTIQLDEQGRIILSKKDLIDDLEDLIIKDLLREGYSSYDLTRKLPERKKELANALLKMAKEAEEEIQKGESVSLEELKKELYSED